jgi:hypothetical protein
LSRSKLDFDVGRNEQRELRRMFGRRSLTDGSAIAVFVQIKAIHMQGKSPS